jgi:gamma-resorcylate decarboxylase
MRNKIAVEEHFVTPALRRCIGRVGWDEREWRRVLKRLEQVEGGRLREMDDCGIELAVLSLGADGIQGIPDAAAAIAAAREANDALAEIVARRPDRFAGLAAVPLQDSAAAADEAERAVRKLGLVGVLVNGYSDLAGRDDGAYYDQPEYLSFWERIAVLEVPLYLHPRNPLPSQRRIYAGREELLGPTWGFAVETGTHALRLITSGLFDRLPQLQVILGHLGEFLPFAIARLEQRMAHIGGLSLERSPRKILHEHFHITTSGNYHTPSLLALLMEMGADRVLFAADHPFERMADGARWFDALPIAETDRLKIGRMNAQRLLRVANSPSNSGAF